MDHTKTLDKEEVAGIFHQPSTFGQKLLEWDAALKKYGQQWRESIQGHEPYELTPEAEDYAVSEFIKLFRKGDYNGKGTPSRIFELCAKAILDNDFESLHFHLKKWLGQALLDISEGTDPTKAFSMSSKQGRPLVDNRGVAIYFALRRRQKQKYDSAVKDCADKYKMTDRNVGRIVKSLPVPEAVSTELLQDLMENGFP